LRAREWRLQLQLLDLPPDPLRGTVKPCPAQLSDQDAEFLDLQRLDLHRDLRRLQLT
jgi:hypothetical protein